MTDTAMTAATQNNLPTNLEHLTDEQLMAETKLCHRRLGQNVIEYGVYLIEWKRRIPHGEFGKWLEDNFNMTIRTAQNFMKCAEHFGNTKSIANLNSTQMIQLLALPAEETEKFIAEQAANDNPVENMHVRELKAKVAEYKARLERQKSEVEKLREDKEELNEIISNANSTITEQVFISV